MSADPGPLEGPRQKKRPVQPAVHRQETDKGARIGRRIKSRRPTRALVRQHCELKVRDKSTRTPVVAPWRSTKPHVDLPYASVLSRSLSEFLWLAGRRHQNT